MYSIALVSSKKQSQELLKQKESMINFLMAKGIEIDEINCEIGGGLNFKRPMFLKMLIEAIEGKTNLIAVAHKDRLCRFAFELIEALLERNGCSLLVANNTNLSPQQELVEDMRFYNTLLFMSYIWFKNLCSNKSF